MHICTFTYNSNNLFLAMKWPDELYNKTYDHRTRSWYTESMTSPKDMIILLDRSGSMTGRRRIISRQIVHDILDTLADNDYVNVFTFANSTEPLITCFNDTLVQVSKYFLYSKWKTLAIIF